MPKSLITSTGLARTHEKVAFVEKHLPLVKMLMTQKIHTTTKMHWSPNGNLLVRLAREELGYSTKTWAGDICLAIWHVWNDLNKQQ